MNEWYKNQKKTTSDLRKLRQERIDKANPGRTELTKEEQQKLEKLDAIAEILRRGD